MFALGMPALIEFVVSVCEVPWVRVRLATLARELAVGAISVEDGRDLTVLPGAFEWLFTAAPLMLVREPMDETCEVLPDVPPFIPSEDIPVTEPFLLWLPLVLFTAGGLKKGMGAREIREDVVPLPSAEDMGGASVEREVVLCIVGRPDGTRFVWGTAVTGGGPDEPGTVATFFK